MGGSSNCNTVNIHAAGASGSASAGASGSDRTPLEPVQAPFFDNSTLGWKQVEGDIFIPEQFTIEEITHYLTTIQVSLVVQTSIGNGTGSKFHVFQLM